MERLRVLITDQSRGASSDRRDARVSFDDLSQMLATIFVASGTSESVAEILGANCAGAERDGAASHGIFRLKGYLASLKAGWVDGKATPLLEESAAGFIRVDAQNGFAQPALHAATPLLLEKVRRSGIACLAIRNSHHFGALWPDLEPFARAGYVCLTAVNSGSRVVPYGGHSKVYGTNPFAFAFPRHDLPPVIFDQASSAMAFGDVRIAARAGEKVAPGVGVDRDGKPTVEASAIVDGGALLPFGGHKGSSIAMMVEVLAAALTGSNFSYRSTDPARVGETANAGQFLLLLDPQCGVVDDFRMRIEDLLAHLADAGQERLPGDRRYETREDNLKNGIPLKEDDSRYLRSLLSAAGMSECQ